MLTSKSSCSMRQRFSSLTGFGVTSHPSLTLWILYASTPLQLQVKVYQSTPPCQFLDLWSAQNTYNSLVFILYWSQSFFSYSFGKIFFSELTFYLTVNPFPLSCFLQVCSVFRACLIFYRLCLWFFHPGRGLKVEDVLKDDEVLTAFLLRDAGLSESVVHQLVNAKIRLEQVKLKPRFNHKAEIF